MSKESPRQAKRTRQAPQNPETPGPTQSFESTLSELDRTIIDILIRAKHSFVWRSTNLPEVSEVRIRADTIERLQGMTPAQKQEELRGARKLLKLNEEVRKNKEQLYNLVWDCEFCRIKQQYIDAEKMINNINRKINEIRGRPDYPEQFLKITKEFMMHKEKLLRRANFYEKSKRMRANILALMERKIHMYKDYHERWNLLQNRLKDNIKDPNVIIFLYKDFDKLDKDVEKVLIDHMHIFGYTRLEQYREEKAPFEILEEISNAGDSERVQKNAAAVSLLWGLNNDSIPLGDNNWADKNFN